MRSKEKYINDITHGESIEFYLNGNIKEKGIRSDYGKIGKWEYFNEMGKLIRIELFDKKGILIEKKILRK
jgi:antitoxin component YwqK of YwqJK toxin-antitoxin module